MTPERSHAPRVRAAGAHGVLEAVAAAGGNPERALEAAGLRASDLADPDRFVDLEKVATLFAAAAKESGDDGFGLHVGCAYDLLALGALSYAVLHAATLGTALHNLERYVHSHLQGARVELQVHGAECRLVFDFPIAGVEGRQGVESAMALVLQILRRLVGPAFRPRRVLFSHPRPASTELHARVFGAPVEFGAPIDGALVFDASELERPIAGADRRLLPIVERHLDQILGAAKNDDAFLRDVRAMVARTVCDGHPSLSAVAKRVGQSPRTLQRRLGERGLVWKQLVEDVRRELALRYLEDGRTPLPEIAFLLGYSEQSAFQRAFRRWTATTPLAFRRAAVAKHRP